jgi:hypothetical protein
MVCCTHVTCLAHWSVGAAAAGCWGPAEVQHALDEGLGGQQGIVDGEPTPGTTPSHPAIWASGTSRPVGLCLGMNEHHTTPHCTACNGLMVI